MTKLADLRDEYRKGSLSRADLKNDPFEQFTFWMHQAIESKCLHPSAMSLATVDKDGMPNVRIVLLKDASKDGFIFYTNYHSIKGNELEINKVACLNFFWSELERQVRISGTITKTTEEQSDSYFQSRPRESQLGALASPQSKIVESEDYLAERYKMLQDQYKGQSVPRPEHWGGYILNPTRIEFWQGRTNRLHDRFVYTKQADSWNINRLAP
ncbi:pyridoxamine 5'-phosphate oxidase [Carboxylicivirga linearis]|uniref:Pyridoxine/pyridoxamine 5'-phosphate oxidase n=1 Tax=Carboxylicivirga linearis TaxID=1628157 RepID=A0ABS5JQ70_9BACT|nr:pyridoxamine 5'-phosphate oxidase [Carboxylicivirga linearis]MBS2096980.1 pyridoxamine 5'-phosphate oxidase [Carboxylicivirga linearis]